MIKLKKVLFYRVLDRFTDQVTEIPRDMLRYDLAFHNPQGRPEIIAFPSLAVYGRGTVKGKVTHPRWESFGTRVFPLLPREKDQLDQTWERDAHLWITYRHPRNADGATEYGELVPISLAQILRAKNLDEV